MLFRSLTTLLLDDSPRKAELQPFNHVCIGEYSGEQRVKDLDSLQKELDWAAVLDARKQLDAHMGEGAPAVASSSMPIASPAEDGSAQVGAASADAEADEAPTESKKRKRKERKLQKRAARLVSSFPCLVLHTHPWMF